MLDSQRLAKFTPRPLGPNQIERHRLLALLERHARAKLVLIQAAAGYGKTTLMLQWYQRLLAGGQGAAWIWLDDDDNDAGRFGAVLSQALSPDADGSVDLFDAINRCMHLHAHFTLFLDEEEHLVSEDAIHLLDVLLDLSPVNMHLVVSSRLAPQKLATRLRMRDDFLELTARDLAFEPDEIVRFVQSRCAIELDTDSTNHLAQCTEGWAAALQLAAVEIGKGETPQVVCAHLAAPHSDLFRYLSEEVLIHLRAEQREFLLQTSFLDELSGPLCDAVTGRSGSELMLLELQRTNLLLQSIDLGRGRFRYHPLFADLLRQQLRDQHPDALPLLARRASEWCAQAQMPENAVEYALLAGDSDWLIVCIESCIGTVMARGQVFTAKRWLDGVAPDVLSERPDLLNQAAWAYLWTSEFAAAETMLASYERLSRHRSIELKDQLGHNMLKALLAILHARYDEADAAVQWACERVRSDDRTSVTRLGNLSGLLAQMRGRFGDAARHAERVLGIASRPPPLWVSQLHAAHISGLTELSLGQPSGALRQFEIAERALIGAQGPAEVSVSPSQLLALLSGAKAFALYETNRLDDAQDCLERHAPFLNCIFSPSSRMLWHQVSARLHALRGDEDACLTALEEGSAYAIRHGVGWMEVLMRWTRVDLDIARGDLNHARSIVTGLLERAPLEAEPDWIAPCEEIFGPVISAIRFLIHTDQSRLALGYLPLHIAHAERQLRRLRLTKLRVLEASAWAALGERPQALAALRVAVGLGQQSGAIRTFVDESSCLELLTELERDRSTEPDIKGYVRRLLAAFAGAEELDGRASARLSPTFQSAVLSVREKQILEHLARGQSNLAVGQQLFLSPNTVKWHLSQLYSKLGVRNRTEAVHVARQQTLLQ